MIKGAVIKLIDYHVGKQSDGGLLPHITREVLDKSCSYYELDLYTLETLDKWSQKKTIDPEEQQYLR